VRRKKENSLMIKPDEVELYRRLRELAPEPYKGPGRAAVEAVAGDIGMCHKRAEYLLEKWIGKRYMDCGVSAVSGWFLPDAPSSLGVPFTAAASLASRFKFDEANNIVEIDGARVSGELINAFTRPTPPGLWFRIIEVTNGVVTVERRETGELCESKAPPPP
jgi:hypothetical protein